MKTVLVISASDNVATALQPLKAGQALTVASRQILVAGPIPSGHKVALVDIAEGAPVIKYGSPIGTATQSIAAGAHVHTHNLSSGRGRGDLGAPAIERDSAARLAEPNV